MTSREGTCTVTTKEGNLISEKVAYHLEEQQLYDELNRKAGKQWHGWIVLHDNKVFPVNNSGVSILLHLPDTNDPLEMVVVKWAIDSPLTGRYEVIAYRGHK